MDETSRTKPGVEPGGTGWNRRRGLLWGVAAVLVAFAAGFLWQYMEASSARAALETTEEQLRVERIRVQLAQAAIAAQSGNFESARQQMSDLFTRLEQRTEQLPDEIRTAAEELLARRDEVITGLSRANPQYVDVLFAMLERLRPVEPQDPAGGAAPTTAEPDTSPAAAPDTGG